MSPIKKKYITRNILNSKNENVCDNKIQILNNVKPNYRLTDYEKTELEILLTLLNSIKNNLKSTQNSEKKIQFRYQHFDFAIDPQSIKFKFIQSPNSEYKEKNLNKILKYFIYTRNHIKLRTRLEKYMLKNT